MSKPSQYLRQPIITVDGGWGSWKLLLAAGIMWYETVEQIMKCPEEIIGRLLQTTNNVRWWCPEFVFALLGHCPLFQLVCMVSFNVQVILSSLLNEVSHHLRRLVFLMSHHESRSHGLQPLISPLKLLNNVSPNDSLRQLGIGSLLLS